MIIYTYPIETAFIRRDVEMLAPHLRVKTLKFTDNPLKLPFFFMLQFFQLLYYAPNTTHYLCFFGGYHSLLPVMFGKALRKKVFIQCGGTDAIHMPEIDYGNYRKKWLRESTIYSFKNCTKIIPVAQALVEHQYFYTSYIPRFQGLKNLIPGLNTPIQVIHNGFDSQFWKDLGTFRSENSFLTVATGISKTNRAMIKGIDLLEQMAEYFPSATFTVIGDEYYVPPYNNIKVLGKLSADKLLTEYNKHQFYLQLSMSEGFPNALGEAMLCGCIPIGSAVGAIPDIIGDAGFILDRKEPSVLLTIINSLQDSNLQTLRILARFRIKTHFNYDDRKYALIALFE